MGTPCTNCIDVSNMGKGKCYTIKSDDVIYLGPDLPCAGVNNGDNITLALQKMDDKLCALPAQGLQATLEAGNIAEDIGAKFTSSTDPLQYTEILNTSVISGAFIKIGGLSTQYLMADGTVTTISNIISQLIPVSATQSGIVNNIALQELGGKDKLIHTVRIGLGAGVSTESTALGTNVLDANTTGDLNTGVGFQVLHVNTTGTGNTGVGDWALYSNTIGNNNTATGVNALTKNVNGSGNTAMGINALSLNVAGGGNQAFGSGALEKATGSNNDAFGSGALFNLSTGSFNVAFGSQSLLNLLTGQFNVAVGSAAGYSIRGNNNTAVGYKAMGFTGVVNTGSNNIAIGFQAGRDVTTGNNNILIENITNASITTGSFNIILDPRQKTGVTTGSNNVLIGGWDGVFATGLSDTVALGTGAGVTRFLSSSTGLNTIPTQTIALITGDATGKAIVTKEYLSSVSTGNVTGTGVLGQVSFWTGANTQSGDNAFFWDNTNKRLGIGAAPGAFSLDVTGTSRFNSTVTLLDALVLSAPNVASANVQTGSLKMVDVGSIRNNLTLTADANSPFGANIRLEVLDITAHIGFNKGGSINSSIAFLFDNTNTNGHIDFRGTNYINNTDLTQVSRMGQNGDDFDYRNLKSGAFLFKSAGGGTINVRINNNGNVGIGGVASSTAPLSKFHVDGGDISIGGTAIGGIRLYNTASAERANILFTGNSLDLSTLTTQPINFKTNNITTMSLSSSGFLSLVNSPITSAGGFDILTRNATTGVVEKIASNTYAPLLHASTHISGGSDPIAGQSLAVTITPSPLYYTPTSATLQGHLLGIDQTLGTINQTTAGISTRVYFTGDNTTVTAGTFFTSNASGKGTVAAGTPQQTVVNGDNVKQYFAKDIISVPIAAASIGIAGAYSGQLTVSSTPTPAGTQQRFTIEVYKTNNGGTPIASGVTGAPVGDLGVTVVAILDSGLVNVVAGSITNINLSGNLASQLTLNVGERLRYHVSAAKVGAGGGNVTMNVYYGTNYNSYYDVPVVLTTDVVINKSLVVGITTSDALNTIDASVLHRTGNLAETFNGLKSAVNIGTTQTTGISLTNNGTTTSAYSLNIDNTSSGVGARIATTGSGIGVNMVGTSTGTSLRISNQGTGLASYFQNQSTGVLSILDSQTASTGDLLQFTKNTVLTTKVDQNGLITAPQFIKTGGLATEYLMANGSVSTLTNPVTGTGVSGQISYWSGTNVQTGSASLTYDSPNGRVLAPNIRTTTSVDVGGTRNAAAQTSGLWVRSQLSNETQMQFYGVSNGNFQGQVYNAYFDQAATGFFQTTNGNAFQLGGGYFRFQGNGQTFQWGVTPTYASGAGIDTSTTFTNVMALTRAGSLSTTGNVVSPSFTIGTLPTTSTTGTYDILTRNTSTGVVEKVLDSSFLHSSTNEPFTGIKSSVNTGATQINGISLVNNGTSGSNSLTVTNNGGGIGALFNNTDAGVGVYFANTLTGAAIRMNSATASTGNLIEFQKNSVATSRIDQNGMFIATNSGTTLTTGVALTNNGTTINAASISITNNDTGVGARFFNAGTGIGQITTNNAGGAGIFVNNVSSGQGLNINSTGTSNGTLVYLDSATGATGDLLRFNKNAVVTTKVDHNGIISTPPPVISTAPTTSAGTYDILTRNTSNGQVEKILSSAVRPYKSYVALVTQTSTNAPVVTVLENSLGGTVVWTYTAVGSYLGTLTSAFPISKTVGFFTKNEGSVPTAGNFSLVFYGTGNAIQLATRNTSNVLADGMASNMSLEIRVYP